MVSEPPITPSGYVPREYGGESWTLRQLGPAPLRFVCWRCGTRYASLTAMLVCPTTAVCIWSGKPSTSVGQH